MAAKAQKTATSERLDVPKQRAADSKAMPLPDALGFSPSKPPNGILMTPGTTRRNKSVSFGAQVVDNEGKKVGRSGLPNSCPGKFPSPWTSKMDVSSLTDLSGTSSQKRTKLTQTLHDVRDASKTKKRPEKPEIKSKDDMDLTVDFLEPRSQSGKYWKREYEAYAEKTQREVKKLLVKQKIAKEYAKDKDVELLAMTEQLRQETAKAEKLEANFKLLESQMRELKENLKRSDGNGTVPQTALKGAHNEAAIRSENWNLREEAERLHVERGQNKTPKVQPSPRRRAARVNKDLWADAMHSSPFVADVTEKFPKRVAEGNTKLTKTGSPLKPRDMNIVEWSQHHSQPKTKNLTADETPKRTAARSTLRSSRESNVLPDDSIDLEAILPQLSPEAMPRSAGRSARTTPRSAREPAGDRAMDGVVHTYSPVKPLDMSSPLPKFDRLALPVGMASDGANTESRNQRKKLSLAESFAKVASTGADGIRVDPRVAPRPGEKNDAEAEHDDAVDAASQRRGLSEEKKIAARERLAAKKAARAG